MQRILCKSKIHWAFVTGADLNYVGSITLDKDLIDAANLCVYEQVHVVNITNGNRLVTYVIEGPRGNGDVCLNGAAARLVSPGDKVIIISYAQYAEEELSHFSPSIVFVDKKNKIVSKESQEQAFTEMSC